MSDTILGGKVTISYLDENRQKRLSWTTPGDTSTITANALYSALQDWFDEQGQMDDGIPMSAQTPVEYTIGIIDAGDLDPWHISYDMMQHITGGAVRTNGWTHVNGSAVGIIVVPVDTGGAIVAADIGKDIVGATTGAGTLLEVITGDTEDYLVIRPDDNTAAKTFTTNDQNITCNAHVSVQYLTVSNTGEQIWANLYSIGTIEPDTHVYVYQGPVATNTGRKRIVSITDATQDWWGDMHIDMCLYIKDFKTAAFSVIDGGYATVFARRGNTLYDSFEVATSTTSGGRNPIPLGTAPDLDNTTGYKSITFTAAAGNWTVGNEMEGDASGARAIITNIVSPGATQVVHYYLLGDPQTDFNTAVETVHNNDDTGTGTKNGSAPANQGPALAAWFTSGVVPTIVFGNTTFDTDDDGNVESYGVTVDCNQNPLTQVYQWLKFITRGGVTATGNTNGIPGEAYIGGEVYLKYSGAITGTIAEGNDVTQETSGATGIIISIDTTLKVILLRNTRGTFFTNATTATLTSNDAPGGTVEIDVAAVTFAPKKSAPLGTFAGGTFFGARGVLLADWITATDENKFQLTPIEGGTFTRPVAILIEVTNLVGTSEATPTDDRVAVFRLTGAGGEINKTEYSAAGGEAIGDPTLTVDGAIAKDVPGKTAGGVLRIRDFSSNNKGYRLRYTSWSGSIFTLANYSFAATAGTNTTTIVKSAGGFTANAKRGDLVVNEGNGHDGNSYVVSVDSDTQLTIFPAITGQISTDNIELNAVPIVMATQDDVYVPLIDKFAAANSVSASIVYDAAINFRVVVRNSAATIKILPFTTDDATSGTSRSIATIRSPDTIIV
jgi:hypothetical protein